MRLRTVRKSRIYARELEEGDMILSRLILGKDKFERFKSLNFMV
jgi:hypothetical protein